jgi:biofilm PGA synthesis N-glycosyltransferase PgaC
MTSLEIFTLILFVSYFLLIVIVIIGFLLPKKKFNKHSKTIGISVLIPFRNEESKLPHLIKSLEKQNYPLAEIIFINDHSTDSSVEIIQNFTHPNYQVKLIHLVENRNGKKSAIEMGIKESSFENILTTDADCVFSENWISLHANEFLNSNKVNAGCVEMESKEGFWNKFQQLEMISIQSVSLGLGKIGKPISMSAANLSYQKDVFQKLNPFLFNHKTASGDDIYFLQSLKKNKININFLMENDSRVITTSQSFNGYIQQRIRWMRKSSSFSDFTTILVGLIIFLATFQFIFITGYQLFTKEWNLLLLISIGLKIIVDFLLLFLVTHHWKKKELLFWFLPVFLMNVFFTTLIPIIGWLIPLSWKGRKI